MTTPQSSLRARSAPPVARYVIGDARLDVVGDHRTLLDELDLRYGDCVAGPTPAPGPHIRCHVTSDAGVTTLSLSHLRPAELVELASCLLRPDRRWRRLVARAGTRPGSPCLVDTGGRERPFLVAEESSVVVQEVSGPRSFLADLLIGAVQHAQPDIAFMHASSVAVAGAGALLTGPSRSGKTTLALAAARQGHGVLGDDVAALRLAHAELVPYRRSASIRNGMPTAGAGTLVRLSKIVGPPSGPMPLQGVFVLSGFARTAKVTPLPPGPARHAALTSLGHEETVWTSWGPSRGRQLLRFLALVDVLDEAPCWRLTVGSPEASVDLIERTLEEPWD
jgi:hypothetical protein